MIDFWATLAAALQTTKNNFLKVIKIVGITGLGLGVILVALAMAGVIK